MQMLLQYDISCQYKILKPDLNGAIVINNQ